MTEITVTAMANSSHQTALPFPDLSSEPVCQGCWEVQWLTSRLDQPVSHLPFCAPKELNKETENHLVVGQAQTPQLREGRGKRLVPGFQ